MSDGEPPRSARSLAREFLVTAPTRDFLRRVQAGLFDEVAGIYRFGSRRSASWSSAAPATC
jgi:hypothetical protein